MAPPKRGQRLFHDLPLLDKQIGKKHRIVLYPPPSFSETTYTREGEALTASFQDRGHGMDDGATYHDLFYARAGRGDRLRSTSLAFVLPHHLSANLADSS